MLIGYFEKVKDYKIWCSSGKPVEWIISRDITFNEKAMLKPKTKLNSKKQK